jgi:hypothetical protein
LVPVGQAVRTSAVLVESLVPVDQTEAAQLLAALEPVAQVAKVVGAGRSVCALQAKR